MSVTEIKQGRYAVVRTLGEGAQGATLEAVDKRDGRLVAIKRFAIRGAKSWKDVELAEREARVLASLSHPLLPAYVDHFEEDGALYLVLEKIEGESLASLRRRGVRFDEQDVWEFLRDSSSLLKYLHSRVPPVIHRDIKPGNVIRRPDGSFALVDFGSVRDSLKPEGGSTVVGTFGYMAPEQFQGRALPATDVYGVGATALSLLTGVEPEALPHRGLSIDVATALRGRDRELVRVLSAMLDPDPDRRARSIESVLERHGPSRPGDSWRYEEGLGDRDERRRATREERYRERAEHRQRRHEARNERHQRRREARNEHRRRRGPSLPLPLLIALLFGVGLIVARVAILVSLRILLPIALTLLAILLGPPLRRAATRVREAGRRADESLRRATRQTMQRDPRPTSDTVETAGVEVTQVEPSTRPRTRVSNAPGDASSEHRVEPLEDEIESSEGRAGVRLRER